jgi:predicted HAD superfamily Cof-like phosphohydrolase
MKTEHQKRVEELMRRADQALPIKPSFPVDQVLQLRANLILEEALETIDALGFDVLFVDGKLVAKHTRPVDIVKVVDGCADVSVVTIGTLSAFGVSDQPILEAVDANNLDKFGPGSYRRESDGKWMKPPGHKAADIMGLLIKQGYGNKYFGQPEHAAPGFKPK